MAIAFEDITKDQLEDIAAIFFDCLHIQYKDFLPSSIRDNFSQSSSLELWRKSFETVPPMKMIGAIIDGQLSGFTKYGANPDNPECGYLASLYVSPSFSRRGIGKALLEKALTDLSQYKCTQLWVFASNLPAVRLYESYGFEEAGVEQTEPEWGALQIQMQLDNF